MIGTKKSTKAVKKKKCVKCGETKELGDFPKHNGAGSEEGSYCKECKNQLAKDRRVRDPIARLKHYTVTRIKNEMGDKAPKDLHTNLENYLGYRLPMLKRHLRKKLKERDGITLQKAFESGYHLDHIKPHSSFNIKEVGDEQFRACWHMDNLELISAEENLKKGKKYDEDESGS